MSNEAANTQIAAAATPQTGATSPANTPAPIIEQPKVQVEVDDRLTSHVAEMARLKRDHAALQQKLKDFESKAPVLNDWESAAKDARKNPLQWLEKAGMSYDDVAQYLLNSDNGKPDPNQKRFDEMNKRLEEAAAEIKSFKEHQQQSKQQQEQKMLQEFRSQCDAFIDSADEKFPHVAAFKSRESAKDAQDIVWQIINNHADTTKTVLTPEQATFELNKFLAKLSGAKPDVTQSAQTAQADKPAQAAAQTSTKTSSLTNNLSAGAAKPADTEKKPSREEIFEASKRRLEERWRSRNNKETVQ